MGQNKINIGSASRVAGDAWFLWMTPWGGQLDVRVSPRVNPFTGRRWVLPASGSWCKRTLTWSVSTWVTVCYPAAQSQKAVSAYFTSKQILPFRFAGHHRQTRAGGQTSNTQGAGQVIPMTFWPPGGIDSNIHSEQLFNYYSPLELFVLVRSWHWWCDCYI